MKLAIVFCLLFTGCAYTELRDPSTGKRVFKTQADATNVTISGPNGIYFHADNLNHSNPTLAQGKAASDKIGAYGSAAAAIGVSALLGK